MIHNQIDINEIEFQRSLNLSLPLEELENIVN